MYDLMTTDGGAALESPIQPSAVFGEAENSQNILFCDLVQQHFTAALAALDVPVSQPPGDAGAETWVTFNEISADGRTASNGVTRLRHLVQLHAWTHSEDDAHRAAFFRAIALLQAAGVRVFGWGPDDYEQDTGIHHIACTCEWWQR